jgi:hypothetical protein
MAKNPDDVKTRLASDTPWRAEVLARVVVLEATAEAACTAAGVDPAAKNVCARITTLLQQTRDETTAKLSLSRRFKEWRGGGPVERAWRNLHSVEILLAQVVGLYALSSQRPQVLSMAKRVLPPKDARTLAVQERLSDTAWKDVVDNDDTPANRKLRNEYVAALTWVHDGCDKNFTRVRSFRNIVLAATAGLFVVAIGLGLVGVVSARNLPLCFDATSRTIDDVNGQASPLNHIVCPTGAQSGPTGGDVPLVLIVGLAAGAFAAALALRNIRGTSTPYGVPVAIALLKLPAGALTALFGTLMLRGAFIPGLSALDTQGQIIAYAIVLGYAQQAFTRLVDNQAQTVLNSSPGTDAAAAAAKVPADAPSSAGAELAITGGA